MPVLRESSRLRDNYVLAMHLGVDFTWVPLFSIIEDYLESSHFAEDVD